MDVSVFVLIHSPLVGSLTWESVAARLRRLGHSVVMPSLTRVFEAGPPYYSRLAACASEAVGQVGPGSAMVVVGHSGAGALLPAITSLIGARVRTAIFVDAILPHLGASWFETAPTALRAQLQHRAVNGWLPLWHEWFPRGVLGVLIPDTDLRARFIADVPKVPVGYIEEHAPEVVGWPSERCAYLQLSAAYASEANDAEARGWSVRRESLHHLAMLTAPDRVTDLLRELAAEG